MNIEFQNYFSSLPVFITIVGTYFITKYQVVAPHKTKIKQKQLSNVYLPLFIEIHDFESEVQHHENQNNFIKKCEDIIYNNMLLVPPELLDYYHDLKYAFYSREDTSSEYKNLVSIVDYDYEKLKRELGYPTGSYMDYYRRMDTPTKFKEILGFIIPILLFITPFLFVRVESMNSFTILLIVVFYLLVLYLVIKLSNFLTTIRIRK